MGKKRSSRADILSKWRFRCRKNSIYAGFAKGLGIEEPVNSPTFTIIQEYHEAQTAIVSF